MHDKLDLLEGARLHHVVSVVTFSKNTKSCQYKASGRTTNQSKVRQRTVLYDNPVSPTCNTTHWVGANGSETRNQIVPTTTFSVDPKTESQSTLSYSKPKHGGGLQMYLYFPFAAVISPDGAAIAFNALNKSTNWSYTGRILFQVFCSVSSIIVGCWGASGIDQAVSYN